MSSRLRSWRLSRCAIVIPFDCTSRHFQLLMLMQSFKILTTCVLKLYIHTSWTLTNMVKQFPGWQTCRYFVAAVGVLLSCCNVYKHDICCCNFVCLSVHVYCGQTAGWIKMALPVEVGLGPGHIVLDGDPATLSKGAEPLLFGPFLLWQNGWMYHSDWVGFNVPLNIL